MNDEIKIIADQLMQSGMEMDSAIDEAIRLSRQSTEEDLRLQDLEDQVMGRSRPYKRGERMLRLLDPSQDPLTGERNIRDFGRQKIANIIPGMTLIGREKVFQGHNPLYNLLQEANRVSKAYHGQDYLKELHHRVMQAGRGRVDKDFGYESSFADGGQVFASDTDKIAQKLIEQGLDRETAMAAALRMAQSRQQADQSILGGVPTQPPVSDVPPATEILGGDPSKLFQRQPTTMERVRDLPKDVLGAADAMASMGSLAALAVPSMLYALRPGQKTQGDPMEFALRNMYMPRSERGPSHLAGLGEVLESLPQTGPLPELQAFTGVGRGVGKQLEEKGKQIKKAKPNKAGQPSEAKKDGGTVNHKAVASARRALEKAMAKGGIAKAVGKAAAKAAVKTEQRGLDLERLKTTGIEVPEAGFSKEDKAVLRPLYNQGLIRVEERDGKKILVPGKGAWYEFATPEQRTRLDALQESQGVKDLSLMGPTESLLNSAQASFYDFEIVPGVRNVPIQSLEPLLPGYESAQEMKRIQNLAKQIKESKQIEPLFIGVDPTGIPYIMEGQHRIRALKSLGYEDVPARIVVDMDDVEKAAGGSVKMAGGGSVIGKAAAAAAKNSKSLREPILINPKSLTFRESDQNRLQEVRNLFPKDTPMNPIVAIQEPDGSLVILDGHNRAVVAAERKQKLPMVSVTRQEYEDLTNRGFDDMEISFAALTRTKQDEAASDLNRQFPGADVGGRGMSAWMNLPDVEEAPVVSGAVKSTDITKRKGGKVGGLSALRK